MEKVYVIYENVEKIDEAMQEVYPMYDCTYIEPELYLNVFFNTKEEAEKVKNDLDKEHSGKFFVREFVSYQTFLRGDF